MKVKIKLITLILIILVMTFTLFAACGKSSQKPDAKQQSAQSEQQSDSNKVPSDLTELENNIEMIVKTLGGPAVQVKEETQQGKQDDSSGQKKQDNSNNQTESNSKEEGQNGQQNQSSGSAQKTQPTQDPMEKTVQIINKIHYQWNNLMPLAIKKGAKKDLINNFDNTLNSLSTTAIGKNKMNILIAANNLYAYIPDLYSLFKPAASPEIKRIRYYTRNATLNSMIANWTQANSDIANLKSTWSLYKNALSKDQQDIANKLDTSIYGLEKVSKEKNQSIAKIKGSVVFSNIEALENAASSKSDKGNQSGGSKTESQSSEGQSNSNQQSGGDQSGGGQTSVYSYIKKLFDRLIKK